MLKFNLKFKFKLKLKFELKFKFKFQVELEVQVGVEVEACIKMLSGRTQKSKSAPAAGWGLTPRLYGKASK